MKSRIAIPFILLAAIGLGVWWFLANFERVPGKEKVGPSGEARLNPFLAAERFAGRMGVRAAQVRTLPQLDAIKPGGVLLLPNQRQSLDAQRIERLLAWVAAGGHLVAEAEFIGVDDPLFDALLVGRESGEAVDKPVPVELKGRRLEVSFPDAMRLNSDASPRLRAGSKLFSFERGKGMVTVATSLAFARNARIGEHDHAAFLWELMQLRPASHFTVYFRPERLSLWGFLARNALPAVLAAGALLLAWVWHIVPRFGPVAPDLPPARRRLLDHLRASGRYYWAKGMRARLVLAARDAALWRLARAQPDFAAAGQAEKITRLTSLVKISNEEAARFLAAAGEMRGAEFIRVTQHAQKIHSALEKGDK